MGVLDDILEQYRFNTEAIANRLEELEREQLLRRPDETGSHSIWLLGHIASSRGIVLNWLRPDGPSDLAEDETKLFGMGSRIADEDVYPPTERLFELIRERGAALEEILSNMSDEDALRPWELGLPFSEKNPKGMLRFMHWHETYHHGQLSYLAAWLGSPLGM